MRALLPFAGSSAMVAGVLLPWMTFYAGLERLNGLQGTNGKYLLTGTAVALIMAFVHHRRPTRWSAALLVLLGTGLAGSSVALLVQAVRMTSRPAMMMLVPSVGPGLYVATAGALLIVLSGILTRPRIASLRSA